MSHKWPLVDPKDDGIRPSGKSDECFYCNQKVGQPHGKKCVCVTKMVKVKYEIEIERKVPYFWEEDNFDFHVNESSSCRNNEIGYIEKFLETLDERGDCMCSDHHEYLKAKWIETVDDTPRRDLRKND